MVTVRSERMAEPSGTAVETASFESFVTEQYARLVALAGLIGGDVTAAEDIVQTALERAWRSRGSLRGDGTLRPWLDRIVAREAARDRRRRLTWLPRLLRPPTVAPLQPPADLVEDRDATRFPERAALRLVLDGLSAPQRAAIVLHLHAGYSVDETATILGVPRETVRSRLRVAREHLRRALAEGD